MALPPPPDLVGDRIHDYGLSGYLRPSSKSGRHRDTALSAERNQSAVYQRTKIREDDTRHRLAGTRLPNRRFPGRRPEIRESFHRRTRQDGDTSRSGWIGLDSRDRANPTRVCPKAVRRILRTAFSLPEGKERSYGRSILKYPAAFPFPVRITCSCRHVLRRSFAPGFRNHRVRRVRNCALLCDNYIR